MGSSFSKGAFDFVPRYAEGIQELLPALAKAMVVLKPDVIVAAAVNAAVPAHAVTLLDFADEVIE